MGDHDVAPAADALALSWQEAVDLLHREARLLDRWQLLEWAELFSDDGEYCVPATDDPDGDPARSLSLIYDDRERLAQRALRLTKRTAHAEYPPSRTTRITSNVVLALGEDGLQRIESNFVVYSYRRGSLDIYPGRAIHLVTYRQGVWLFRKKTAILSLGDLRQQQKLSILL